MDSGKGDPLLHNSLPPSRASPVNYDQERTRWMLSYWTLQKPLIRYLIKGFCISSCFYEIRGDTLKWIEAFLGHRKQQVLLDGRISQQADAISGVPHGTVLGALLFLAFINDLPKSVKASDPRPFADDCLLYKLINCDADAESVQQDLLALEEWGKKVANEVPPRKNVRSFTSTPTNDIRDTPFTSSMVKPLKLLTVERISTLPPATTSIGTDMSIRLRLRYPQPWDICDETLDNVRGKSRAEPTPLW